MESESRGVDSYAKLFAVETVGGVAFLWKWNRNVCTVQSLILILESWLQIQWNCAGNGFTIFFLIDSPLLDDGESYSLRAATLFRLFSLCGVLAENVLQFVHVAGGGLELAQNLGHGRCLRRLELLNLKENGRFIFGTTKKRGNSDFHLYTSFTSDLYSSLMAWNDFRVWETFGASLDSRSSCDDSEVDLF